MFLSVVKNSFSVVSYAIMAGCKVDIDREGERGRENRIANRETANINGLYQTTEEEVH